MPYKVFSHTPVHFEQEAGWQRKKKKLRFGGQTGTRILLFPGPGTRDLPAPLTALVPCRSMPPLPPHPPSCPRCLPACPGGRPCCLRALPWPSAWDSTKLGMVCQHLLSKQMGGFLSIRAGPEHSLEREAQSTGARVLLRETTEVIPTSRTQPVPGLLAEPFSGREVTCLCTSFT